MSNLLRWLVDFEDLVGRNVSQFKSCETLRPTRSSKSTSHRSRLLINYSLWCGDLHFLHCPLFCLRGRALDSLIVRHDWFGEFRLASGLISSRQLVV